jgi:HK97 family phage prohead protease
MEMKQYNIPWNLKSCDETGSFSGYASVFDVIDRQGEAVAKGAFQKSIQNWRAKGEMPKMLWQHDPKHPIGLWHSIVEDDCGLFVKGQFLLDIPQGAQAYTLLKAGIVDGLSVGFQTKRSRQDRKNSVRLLEEIDLFEISLVTFAANPMAKVMDVKSFDPEELLLIRRLDQLGEMLRE